MYVQFLHEDAKAIAVPPKTAKLKMKSEYSQKVKLRSL